jgi:hypothetical protein
MNTRPLVVVVAVAVVASTLVLLGECSPNEPVVSIGESSTGVRDEAFGVGGLIDEPSNESTLVRGESSRRQQESLPDPHKIVLDEAWVRAAPEIDMRGMRGREILAAYWGDEWPAFEEFQGERLTIVDSYWSAPGDVLGQPEDMFEDLVECILDGLDGNPAPPQMVALYGGAAPSPWDPSGEFDELLAEAKKASGGSGQLDPMVRMQLLSQVKRLLDPLAEPWSSLDQALRLLVVEQLSGLDRFTKPRLGSLTVCPLMNYGPPPAVVAQIEAGLTSRWFMSFTGSARLEDGLRPSVFIGQWVVDISFDPRCAAAIAVIVEMERDVEAQLEALIPVIASELQ